MVVTIQGAGYNTNVIKTASTLAEFCALNKKKKTLLLQICNKTDDNAENMLQGSAIRSMEIGGASIQTGKGIDVLLREVDSQKLTPDLFETYTTSLCNTQNLFNVANCTSKKDAMPDLERICGKPLSYRIAKAKEQEISKEMFEYTIMDTLIEEAKAVYDIIIISLTYCTENVRKYFIDPRISDKNLYIIPQGRAREITTLSEDPIFIVPNYEHNSKYNLKLLATAYKTKEVFPIEYNIGYNDATEEGSLYKFLAKNRHCKKTDDNFDWCNNIKHILIKITGEKEDLEEDPIWRTPVDYYSAVETVQDIDKVIDSFEMSAPQEVEEQSKEKKKMFGKKKKNIPEERTVEYEEIIEEEIIETAPSSEEVIEEIIEEVVYEEESTEGIEEAAKRYEEIAKESEERETPQVIPEAVPEVKINWDNIIR